MEVATTVEVVATTDVGADGVAESFTQELGGMPTGGIPTFSPGQHAGQFVDARLAADDGGGRRRHTTGDVLGYHHVRRGPRPTSPGR